MLLWFSKGYLGLFDMCQTDYSIHSKLKIFPLFRSHTWSTTFKLTKGSIWCFRSFFLFLHCNVPDNKCCKQKWGVLFFTCIKLVTHVLACACAITRIKWKRLFYRLFSRFCLTPSSIIRWGKENWNNAWT